MATQLSRLVERAQSGDRKALESLCRNLQEEIRLAISRVISDPEIVDDLCQDTYVRLVTGIKHVREPTKIKFFVAKLSTFAVKDYFRKRNKIRNVFAEGQGQLENGKTHAEKDHSYLKVFETVEIEKLVNAIPNPSDKRLIELRLRGETYSEISAKLLITEAAAKMRYKRAVEFLRRKING